MNEVKEILTKYRIVAIVGLSRDPSKDSYRVAEYLKNHGFHVVPVNPFAGEVLGEKSYNSLLDLPLDVQKNLEIVDIFRPSQEVPSIVEHAVKLKTAHGKPHVIWMQLGIINEQAAQMARKAGMSVVMDKCMMQEHKRLSTIKQ
ncbi:MAG: CoA-binding protein [Candidatus Bathyarchaeia archaeon]